MPNIYIFTKHICSYIHYKEGKSRYKSIYLFLYIYIKVLSLKCNIINLKCLVQFYVTFKKLNCYLCSFIHEKKNEQCVNKTT